MPVAPFIYERSRGVGTCSSWALLGAVGAYLRRAGGLLTFGQMKAVRRAYLRCSNGFFATFSPLLAILENLWNLRQKGWVGGQVGGQSGWTKF